MADMIKFYKGALANLPQSGASGALYITTDEGAIYLGQGEGSALKRLGDFVQVASVSALPTDGANENALYYCVSENILAKWNGSDWSQINKDTGMTAVDIAGEGNSITAASYDATTRKLTLTKGETFATKAALDELDQYVGEIPSDEKYADISTIVGYINKKAEETLASAQGGSSETAASVKAALDTYKTENDAKVTANTEAIADIKDGTTVDSFADVETELAKKVDKVEGKSLIDDTEIARLADMSDGANKVEASETNGYIKIDGVETKVYEHPEKHAIADVTGLQDAIDDAKNAGTDAADALETYKGTNDAAVKKAQETADAKVASVTAADNSVTVAGTATAPTVAAKLSADADNALTLADDGLKVVIPAAAEYSIVKAEDSGDYAAIYNLTKDGTIVGDSINIPKDMVVKSGSVVGDEIVLVLNDEANTEIKIPVASLIEYVTSGSAAGDMVVVNVSDDHKVTATITDGTITLAKLATDIQTAIGKAHSHENADVLNGIDADDVAAWDAAEGNAKAHADGLNTTMSARVDALEAIDHSHANSAELDLIASGDKAKWDAAAAKAHEHANAEELAKIVSGDVAKWNAAQANAEATAAGALASAKSELEGKISAAETAAKGHADTKVNELANGAVATNTADIAILKGDDKTDGSVAKALADAKAYADTAESDAVTTANAYTDSALTWGSF